MNRKETWIGVGALACGLTLAAALFLLLRRAPGDALPGLDRAASEGGVPQGATAAGSAAESSRVLRALEDAEADQSGAPVERALPAAAPDASPPSAHGIKASQGTAIPAFAQRGMQGGEPGKGAESWKGGGQPVAAGGESGPGPAAGGPSGASEAALSKVLAEAGKTGLLAADNYYVPEMANLKGLLTGHNPMAAMAKITKAMPLAHKLEAMSRDFSKLDEQYNQKSEDLQAAQQSHSGQEGSIRQEMASLEGMIRNKAASIQAARSALDSLVGKAKPISAQDRIMPSLVGVSPGATVALKTAYAQMGKPYVFGGSGPKVFDCSGLTLYSWRAAGISMSHSAARQGKAFPRVPNNALQLGDSVYFGNPVHHVAMYVGKGKIIHAPMPGERVRIGRLAGTDYVFANRPGAK